jgi:hypothetical protein
MKELKNQTECHSFDVQDSSGFGEDLFDKIISTLDSCQTFDEVQVRFCVIASQFPGLAESAAFLFRAATTSKNPLVWTFLTSINEWNVGSDSLRFFVKTSNPLYEPKQHQRFLFHKMGTMFVTFEDFMRSMLGSP